MTGLEFSNVSNSFGPMDHSVMVSHSFFFVTRNNNTFDIMQEYIHCKLFMHVQWILELLAVWITGLCHPCSYQS